MEWIKKARICMALTLCASLGLTGILLLLEGRGRDALPLHLCGLSALCAAAAAARPRAWMLDVLWYLGMPGALLALLFPAPAVARFQLGMNFSYAVTHLLILAVPAALMLQGMRPNRGKAPVMLLLLNLIALPVYGVNRLLGSDYLFLMAPPAGTPLEAAFSLGIPAYIIVLETVMLLGCMGMEKLAALLFRETGK